MECSTFRPILRVLCMEQSRWEGNTLAFERECGLMNVIVDETASNHKQHSQRMEYNDRQIRACEVARSKSRDVEHQGRDDWSPAYIANDFDAGHFDSGARGT
jgi:hypothetical protein